MKNVSSIYEWNKRVKRYVVERVQDRKWWPQRFFYTDEKKALRLKNKPYFNKNTDGVIIYKGFETKESSEAPISEEIIFIVIDYHISNYFGDRDGRHFRSKTYLLIDDKILNQCDHGKVKEVIRFTKELKGILGELN